MLTDAQQRVFPYLRLSVTEACNFKCTYCLPDGYKARGKLDFLSLAEIVNLASAFRDLGVKKIRLTGGEPTLRRDLPDIVRALRNLGPDVHLSTNGYKTDLRALKDAGLQGINFSLDSLDAGRFRDITGIDGLDQVARVVDRALDLGFSTVKINAVLLKDRNDDQLDRFLEFVHARPVDVRFIELMETKDSAGYFRQHHLPVNTSAARLRGEGWRPLLKSLTDGPAETYGHDGFKGRIGFIAPYQAGFCEGCNRLRVSARGALRLCLLGEGEHSLRPWLVSSGQREKLISEIRGVLTVKPPAHRLNESWTGDMASFSSIGG